MIVFDSHTKSKLLWIGVLLSPIIGVQSVRFLLADGVSSASADTAAAIPDSPSLLPSSKVATARQKLALEWIVQSCPKHPLHSPLKQPIAAATAPTKDVAPSIPAPIPVMPVIVEDDRPLTLKITGIMGTNTGTLAVINHKLRRLGDELAPGWTMIEINTKRRLIILKHTDGRTFELSIPVSGE